MYPITFVNLLCLGKVLFLNQLTAAADLTEDYKKDGIIPDVLDKAPKNLLQVTFNGKSVEIGKELTPSETKEEPSIVWNFDPSSFYTLIMNDPDAPSRADPYIREFLHWALVNIPGNDFNKGELFARYITPGPPKGTGFHRYLITVYQQPGRIKIEETPMLEKSLDGRKRFKLRNFAKKYGLGEPVAGITFIAQFDDYVPIVHKEIGFSM